MGSKKRSPQPPVAAADAAAVPVAGGEVSGDAGPAAALKPPDVAPFLTKVFDMVSDPPTDAVISWGSGGGSFVIWDAHAFERDVLPRYFKHNHFTSFIRQLNTYGFRKVDPDRWEWANDGFLRGQKHLLKTIKRKKKSSQDETGELQHMHAKAAPGNEYIEIGKYGGLEKEVETLKRDKTLLMQQLVDLRHYQQTSNLEVQNLIQRLKVMEQNQQQMMALLAIVVQNPNFLTQLVQQHRRSNWWRADGNKKRRFHALEQGPTTNQASDGEAQMIKYQPPVTEPSNQVIPVNGVFSSTTAQPVLNPEFSMPMDTQTTSCDVNTFDTCGEPFHDPSALLEWDFDAMQLDFEDDLLPVHSPFGKGGQTDPLTIQDYGYQQFDKEYQTEAQHNYNPQYADVITEA